MRRIQLKKKIHGKAHKNGNDNRSDEQKGWQNEVNTLRVHSIQQNVTEMLTVHKFTRISALFEINAFQKQTKRHNDERHAI